MELLKLCLNIGQFHVVCCLWRLSCCENSCCLRYLMNLLQAKIIFASQSVLVRLSILFLLLLDLKNFHLSVFVSATFTEMGIFSLFL